MAKANTKDKKQDPTLPIPDGWGDAEEVGDPYGETIDLSEEGPVVGIYRGSRTIETQTPDGKARDSAIHDFVDADGQMVSVWGSHDLDRKLTEELEGEEVLVEYQKTIPIKSGKQSLKIFRVLRRTK